MCPGSGLTGAIQGAVVRRCGQARVAPRLLAPGGPSAAAAAMRPTGPPGQLGHRHRLPTAAHAAGTGGRKIGVPRFDQYRCRPGSWILACQLPRANPCASCGKPGVTGRTELTAVLGFQVAPGGRGLQEIRS